MSGSLNPCTHHLALALYPVSVSFQRRTRREEITRSRCFSLITSACAGSMMVTALKSSTPCHSVSIAFENCVCSSAEAVPRYLVGVHAACSPRPTQSTRFRVPCFLRRRSFVSLPLLSGCSSFFLLWSASIVRVGRVASSFCILPKVLPRSCSCKIALQLDYRLQQPYSPVGARTFLLRRNEKEQRIHLPQLVLVFSHADSSIDSWSEDASR